MTSAVGRVTCHDSDGDAISDEGWINKSATSKPTAPPMRHGVSPDNPRSDFNQRCVKLPAIQPMGSTTTDAPTVQGMSNSHPRRSKNLKTRVQTTTATHALRPRRHPPISASSHMLANSQTSVSKAAGNTLSEKTGASG
jgi:hypothetical protein